VCFTINKTSDGVLPDDAELRLRLSGVAQFCFQLEVGKETGRVHWQGWARHTGAKTYKQWHKLLGPNAWVSKQKARHNADAWRYCCKEDTRMSLAESLSMGIDKDSIGPFFKGIVMEGPKVLSPLDNVELYPYQQDLMDVYEGEPHPRTIYWIWEKTGNCGKSAFTKHLAIKGDTLCVTGKESDVSCGVADWVQPKKGKPAPLRCIIWDLPRIKEGKVSFAAMESVKNGCFFSSKYESKMIIMKTPHIFVFANFPPDKSALSADRWCIYNINDEKRLVRIDDAHPIFSAETREEGREDLTYARSAMMGGAAHKYNPEEEDCDA
jgi:hypothetical protein